MINWGCGRSIVRGAESTIVLNNDISEARSKVRTFERLAEAEIPHPRWSRSQWDLRRALGETRSYLARMDNASGGARIHLVRPGEQAAENWDFYVERLSYQRELRVHVWRGEVIASQVKVLPPGCTNFVHSYDYGCTFSQDTARWGVEPETLRDAQDLAVRAVAAVGLDFGAVDLMLTRRGRLYVLEVNSAPGIRCEYIKAAYRGVLEPMQRRRS